MNHYLRRLKINKNKSNNKKKVKSTKMRLSLWLLEEKEEVVELMQSEEPFYRPLMLFHNEKLLWIKANFKKVILNFIQKPETFN